MELTFDEALARIDALEPRGWRLGLDRMRAFCDHAALAHWIKGDAPQFIHVAGTNGKGSTTAFVERLLREAGFRTGAFFSPFVKEYRERIQVNGELITEADLTLFTGRLLQQADTFEDSEFGGITKFEFEAALGFLVWGEKRCDWVALEVGLGGRLDATNVILPKCSIIVSIGLDHVAILGGSLPEIAREKAGIIKPLVPVIIGEMAEEASEVIEAKAAEMGAPVWRFGQEILLRSDRGGLEVETPASIYSGLKPGLLGSKQPHNLALAVASLDAAGLKLSNEVVRKAALETYAPARFERHVREGVTFVVDGAHNADAAHALVATLGSEFPTRTRRILVVNTLSGHDPVAFYAALQGIFEAVEIAPIGGPRSLDPDAAMLIARDYLPKVRAHSTVIDAIEAAMEEAGEDGLVVVTGSNYLAGEVLRLFDRDAPASF